MERARDEEQGIDTRSLIWSAMGDADIHRRYYTKRRDRLMTWNSALLAGTWMLSLIGALFSLELFGSDLVRWAVACIITAAGITTLRDVIGIPDRIAEARSVVILANDEYDTLRVLWETGGQFRPATELESYRRISRASNIINESIRSSVLETARKESHRYHEQIIPPRHSAIRVPDSTTGT